MSKEKFEEEKFLKKIVWFRPGPLASRLKSARLSAKKLWIQKSGGLFWLSVAFAAVLSFAFWRQGLAEYRAEVRSVSASVAGE